MTGEPIPAQSRADAGDPALAHAREHLERLGYQLVEQHRDIRTGTRLLILASDEPNELVFCELCTEGVGERDGVAGGLRRRRLRRAALAWLAANHAVEARRLRFDRLSVFVARDGAPVGLEYEPQAF